MGVYSDVYICVRAEAPLDVEKRVAAVQICMAHDMLSGTCRFVVPGEPAAIEPPGLWKRIVAFFKRTPGTVERPKQSPFVERALGAYGEMSGDAFEVIEEDKAGRWLLRHTRETATNFAIGTQSPKWEGEPCDGGFTYLATSEPFKVHTFNAYEKRGTRRNPHVPEDGYVGSFYDVFTFSSRRGPDGRAMASSPLVRALKKELGVKVTCRASWW